MPSEKLYQIARKPSRAWRSLEEAESPQGATTEFPPEAMPHVAADEVPRRDFMKLLGGGSLFSAACSREAPPRILPYTRAPFDVVPGISQFYATAMELDGYAGPLLVESREGRPLKVQPNQQHPYRPSGTSMFQEASVWQLYDDWRGRRPRGDSLPISWSRIKGLLAALEDDDDGAGIRLMLPPSSSPLQNHLLELLAQRFARLKVCRFFGVPSSHPVEGAQLAFGQRLLPQYNLLRATVVLSLDADVLGEMPDSLRYAQQWAQRRRLASPTDDMNRLYVVENLLSPTGSVADHRLRRKASDVLPIARALAYQLLKQTAALAALNLDAQTILWVQALADDLQSLPAGQSLIIAGERQPSELHALAYAMNERLGNLGSTLAFSPPLTDLPSDGAAPEEIALPALVTEMLAGTVRALVMLESNPVYAAPADLPILAALKKVPLTFCFSYYEHETARACRYYGPTTHFLESWGDSRSYDGTVCTIQPLIRPLVAARTPTEILAFLGGQEQPRARELLRKYWLQVRGLDEAAFRAAIQSGFVPDTQASLIVPTLKAGYLTQALRDASPVPNYNLEIAFYLSPTVHDGRFANVAWLLEQPSPMFKLTWENAALMSKATAYKLGLKSEARVALQTPVGQVDAPVLVVPGMADDSVAVWLGYGRQGQEEIARGRGFNAYQLRSTLSLYHGPVSLTRLPGKHPLALTQTHWNLHDRPVALSTSLAAYRANPLFTAPLKGPVPSLLPEYPYTGDQWAMTIDTTICTGCSACMVACQAENNVMVVGKENVLKSREMHWLRIDTYYEGSTDNPVIVHQPMACQHCEKAPCEYVCPVNATVHSDDGLNEMIYNRCIGTRFCSNNCPYKVRRFNFFDYAELLRVNRGGVQLQYNPEVTVRERGVMEKCTYCVQRIRRKEIEVHLADRGLEIGDVVTACQQACPTGAIQFGSLAHLAAPVVQWRLQPRSYFVLHNQGTQPRTAYLARINNPNLALAALLPDPDQGEHE